MTAGSYLAYRKRIMTATLEGPIKKGKFWRVIWDGNELPTPHETKSSAQAHYEDLLRKREISKRNAEVDITKDVSDGPRRPQDLALVSALARKHEELTLEMFGHLKKVAELKERIEKIELDQLPNLMMQLSIPRIPVMISDGGAICHQVDIKIEDIVRASLPSKGAISGAPDDDSRADLIARKASAFAWLRAHNAESLIKNLVIVTLPKGKDSLAEKIIALATKLKLTAERDETVHPSTLNKFVRELMEKGDTPIPFDTFNISTGKRAKITNPKLKAEKQNVKNNDEYEE